MKKTLLHYRRRLFDLTPQNRGLFLRNPDSKLALEAWQWFQYTGHNPFDWISFALSGKRVFELGPQASSDALRQQLSLRMKHLARQATLMQEEKGNNDFYLGWPMMQGILNKGTLVQAPLLLFPMRIQLFQGQWRLQRNHRELHFNPTFLLAYEDSMQQRLPEQEMNEALAELPEEEMAFRVGLYELLKKFEIGLQFNRDTFKNELVSFPYLKSSELSERYTAGQLRLFPSAILGFFPDAAAVFIHDYETLLKKGDLPESLDQWLAEPNKDDSMPSLPVYALPTDASQRRALAAAALGQSMVIQGPPGSGKSQFIANLAVDAVSKGKKVLIISQKRVALEVLLERLSELGLQDFLGFVEDEEEDRTTLFARLAQRIQTLEQAAENPEEEKIRSASTEVALLAKGIQLQGEFKSFYQALADSSAGVSLRRLYLHKSASEKIKAPTLALATLPNNLETDSWERVLNERIRFRNSSYAFAHRRLIGSKDFPNKERIAMLWPSWDKLLAQLETKVFEGFTLQSEDDFEALNTLAGKASGIHQLWEGLPDKLKAEYRNGAGPELKFTSIPFTTLTDFLNAGCLNALTQAQFLEIGNLDMTNPWLALWRLHFKKGFKPLKNALKVCGLKPNLGGLRDFSEQRKRRKSVLAHYQAEQKAGFSLPSFNAEDSIWLQWEQDLAKLQKIALYLQALQQVNINGWPLIQKNEQTLWESLETIYRSLENAFSFTTNADLLLWKRKAYRGEDLSKLWQQDFASLTLADALEQECDPTLLSWLIWAGKEWNEDSASAQAMQLLDVLVMAWIKELQILHPILTSWNPELIQYKQEDWQKVEEGLHASFRDGLSTQWAALSASYQVFNRIGKMVAYRDLKQQVQKKRSLWPIRKLFAQFHEPLARLVPCWLMSPEQAIKTTPPEPVFDLVIFDEASQCFTEHALSLCFRAKQLIVCGDHQQLAPSDLYKSRIEEEEDDEIEVIQESFLDFASAYLPSYMLEGHYRSKRRELIAFSNRYFYENRLKLIPFKQDQESISPAFYCLKVQGFVVGRSNQEEVNAILTYLPQLRKQFPNQRIGIVTLNYPQAMLLWEALEKDWHEALLDKSIEVRNLENVQGNEWDHVLISTVVAPDKSGKLRQHFGLLNRSGGENRLNVLMSRARYSYTLVSSIEPSDVQLKPDSTQGVVLFRRMLELFYTALEQNLVQPFRYPEHSLGNRLTIAGKARHALSGPFFGEDNKVLDTDDFTSAAPISLWEAHVFLPSILKQRGWKYQRLFTPYVTSKDLR